MGADFAVISNKFYTTDEDGGWMLNGSEKPLQPRLLDTGGFELEIPTSYFGDKLTGTQLGIGYVQLATADGPVTLKLPEERFWRSAPSWIAGGMIVPAYIEINNSGAWEALKAAATKVAAVKAEHKDFWIVLNGASGPRKSGAADANTLSKTFQPAAKVFGYVHSCVTEEQDDHTFKCIRLREPGDVEKEIDQWLGEFPALDGIWIDEFYPHFEGNSAPEGKQVATTGGFYERITTYIRNKSGPLKIIGNAGGHLKSNRLKYAGLVDVLCSFESSGNALEPAILKDGTQWPGIARQTVKPRDGQLALIHTVADPATMESAVQRAFAEGYSHVFVADGTLPDKTAWHTVPPYLGSELHAVWPEIPAPTN